MSAEVRRRQCVDGNLLLCATKSPDLPARLGARERVSMFGPPPFLGPPYHIGHHVDDGDDMATPTTTEFRIGTS